MKPNTSATNFHPQRNFARAPHLMAHVYCFCPNSCVFNPIFISYIPIASREITHIWRVAKIELEKICKSKYKPLAWRFSAPLLWHRLTNQEYPQLTIHCNRIIANHISRSWSLRQNIACVYPCRRWARITQNHARSRSAKALTIHKNLQFAVLRRVDA